MIICSYCYDAEDGIVFLPFFSLGFGHWHVQTHESVGWSEDDGGDQEGDELWSAAAGQLHRQNTSKCLLSKTTYSLLNKE